MNPDHKEALRVAKFEHEFSMQLCNAAYDMLKWCDTQLPLLDTIVALAGRKAGRSLSSEWNHGPEIANRLRAALIKRYERVTLETSPEASPIVLDDYRTR